LRVHLIANVHRKDAIAAVADAASWLTTGGHTVGFESETARELNGLRIGPEEFSACDVVVAFGGDGTLIRAAHLCSERGTPILGVYFGRFGFVTQCNPQDIRPALDRFFKGEAHLDERGMVAAELLRGGNPVTKLHALNEVVLQRAVTARMMTFRVWVDGHRVTSYPADGVLVSTPTGSTAYNLSAGGPIMDPNVSAIMLTAIAPHTLSARPLILRPESEIRLKIMSDGDAVLSVDSQTRLHILAGDEVRVTQSTRVTNLITVHDADFLMKLNHKMFWSKGLTENVD
jgi:NAD+ kinase